MTLNDCKMKPILKKIRFLHTTHREGGSRRIIWFPPLIKLTVTQRYQWNIVESGVKHHKPYPHNEVLIYKVVSKEVVLVMWLNIVVMHTCTSCNGRQSWNVLTNSFCKVVGIPEPIMSDIFQFNTKFYFKVYIQ